MNKYLKNFLKIGIIVLILAIIYFFHPTIKHNEPEISQDASSVQSTTKKNDMVLDSLTEKTYESKKEQSKAPEITVIENEPEEMQKENVQQDGNFTCSILVRCDTILKNPDLIKEEIKNIIPKDGVIYKAENVVFYEGESAFNVLSRELKKNKIHFEFNITPIYNTAYIEAIANIYEFDCGELSGWIYKVNNKIPDVGSSLYIINDGDTIEFVYSCNMGKDV